ncbi:MAG: hypothetical protein C3F13_06925 [Anaerolineales bacterium]|nr:MAG: hypothetical protein C3F13_06925 [Anaerolineales bacterium]
MQRDNYRASLFVGLGFLAATLTGFMRQVFIARFLGASRVADIYLVAFAVPEFFFIALPIIISPAFLPIFTKIRQEEGEAKAWLFAKRVFLILGVALFLLTILAALLTPFFLKWLSPGFSAAEQEQAISLFYPMLPGILFMGLATLLATILLVYRRFFRSVIITSVYNLVFIISLGFLPISQVELRASWAVTIGAGAALLCLLPFWWTQTHTHVISTTSELKAQIIQWGYFTSQLIVGYGVHHAIIFIDRAMATSLGTGGVAALSYSNQLTQVIITLSGLAISTALFPSLAEQVAGGDFQTAGKELTGALILVFKIALPACAGLVLLRTPIVQVLFEHGAFDAQATSLVSAPIVWYSLAALADSLCQPLWRIVYINRSGWMVVGINGVQTTIRVILNLLLTPWLGYIGLAVSAAVGLAVQVVVLAWWTRSTYGFKLSIQNRREITRTILAAFLALSVSFLLYNATKSISSILIILICSITGALVYFLSLYLSHNFRRSFYGS